ncbi:MAG: glycosyltransferase family 9 protein [Ignavibacteria bacterium]|nr:glycosyltransferase family 9 protein [Bacteroidota bacterium]MBL7128818.1 glycosyltransferase family 9 protein [Ignavibacteria bacterium]
MILWILKLFLRSKEIEKKDIRLENIKKILIVRQHNQLGDMLCAVPLFAALRNKFPDAEITLVASPINYEILYSDINPYIDDVIVYRKSTFKELKHFFRKLRSKKYDLGIVPSTVSLSRTSHFINYLSRAPVRVGVKSIDGKLNKTEFLLNVKSDFEWDKKKMHQTERNLDVGRQLGIELHEMDKIRTEIKLSKEEIRFGEKYIKDNFNDDGKPIIAFHPGAGKIQNRWSVDKFYKLIILLREKYNNHILITSGSIDKKITDKLKNNLKAKGLRSVILDNTTIRKVAAVITKTNLYITNDTGTLHVGGYVNANVLALFGSTHGYEWAPERENVRYIQSPTDNVNDISVGMVFDEASKFLDIILQKSHNNGR